ncbi:MFS transporter [Thermogymnomonas acidicola]|uniref:MFS transporter n=1 Tax=Thermogymnomonas acidicola TaxID=399579 RepID=UPI0009467D47|nr:MFS transporter [Thermogymnomonas acidicola]
MADRFGRKVMYVVDLSIMTAFALISAFSSSVPMLMASRFFLGMGIGGDYPVSSTLMSEYSGIRHRGGKLVSMVFAMQGFGLLLGAMVGVLSVAFLPLGVAWRVMLGGQGGRYRLRP